MRFRLTFLLVLLLSGTALFSLDIARDIVSRGSALVGTPYRYGGTTPSGFDCSGLVNYLYKPHIPSLPRSASAMSNFGTTVPISQLAPGDLVFYATGADWNEVTHVGIYIGQNTLIQSVSAGPERGVILTDLDEKYWKNRYKWSKRVFPEVLKAQVKPINVTYSRGSYSGTVENLEPEGYGVMELNNGDIYEGEFQKGLFHGLGEYKYRNGDKYVGEFEQGREVGGEIIRSDGSRYSAARNEAGTLYIARRADRSSNRINHLLEVPTQWDEWLAYEKQLFEESLRKDREAVQDEQDRFEEWKKNSDL